MTLPVLNSIDLSGARHGDPHLKVLAQPLLDSTMRAIFSILFRTRTYPLLAPLVGHAPEIMGESLHCNPSPTQYDYPRKWQANWMKKLKGAIPESIMLDIGDGLLRC